MTHKKPIDFEIHKDALERGEIVLLNFQDPGLMEFQWTVYTRFRHDGWWEGKARLLQRNPEPYHPVYARIPYRSKDGQYMIHAIIKGFEKSGGDPVKVAKYNNVHNLAAAWSRACGVLYGGFEKYDMKFICLLSDLVDHSPADYRRYTPKGVYIDR